jgi:hypothetical protein
MVCLAPVAGLAKGTTTMDAAEAKIPDSLNAAMKPANSVAKPNGTANNFTRFEAMLKQAGWVSPCGAINGFSLYEAKDEKANFVCMRNCGGDCCEGIVALKPVDNETLQVYLSFIYAPLQNTLASMKENYVAPHAAERTPALRQAIMDHLKSSDHAEFEFDHLNVRADCHAIPESDFKAGMRPEMIIKLWIP